MHYSRRIASLHAFVHLCPAVIAIILLMLNTRGHFVGDVSPSAITALQFAAKTLEVLIQASLSTILLSLIRHQALFTRRLPLGSLVAPVNATKISYLWSLELWGPLTFAQGWDLQKGLTLSFIIATIILAAIVGPSSAVLMIPRPISAKVSRSLLFLDDAATLFPTGIHSNSSILV